jgi:glutamate carboxypeptidase
MAARPRLVAFLAGVLATTPFLVQAQALKEPADRAAASADKRILQAVDAEMPDLMSLWRQTVDIDSGTGDVVGGEAVEAVLAKALKSCGAEVETRPSETPGLPGLTIARMRGSGALRLLMIAHVDTVFAPGTARGRPFTIVGGRALGPGVGDEKAGAVEAVAALCVLNAQRISSFASVTLLLDNSEERGSPGSTQLIRTLARAADVEFNMEPGDPPDALTVWRKGSESLRIHVRGRAAHAGMAPQNGRNAAVELLHQLALEQGRFPTSGDGLTVNLTLLRAGERNNIIPDDAEATLNIRYRDPEDLKAVLASARTNAGRVIVPDTSVQILTDPAFPPLLETPATNALAQQARRIYAELGRPLAMSGNGGASESALAQSEGAIALDGLGFVGGDFHTDHEWVDLSSVRPRLYLLVRLITDLAAAPPTHSPPAAPSS